MAIENSSGMGKLSSVPAEVDRWNWGAFFLSWFWGIFNGTWIALLMFVPFINIVMPFVLGLKGSAWAWRNKRWESTEHFRRVQRRWGWAGLVVTVLLLGGSIASVVGVLASFSDSEPHNLAMQKVAESAEAEILLGQPVETGFPMGSFEVSGPSGRADLSFDVTGPKGEGTLYLAAVKRLGQWELQALVLEMADTGRRIDLLESTNPIY